jgi:hypothetical protein
MKISCSRKSGAAAGINSDISVIHGPANVVHRCNNLYTRVGRIILEDAGLEALRVRLRSRPRVSYVCLISEACLNVYLDVQRSNTAYRSRIASRAWRRIYQLSCRQHGIGRRYTQYGHFERSCYFNTPNHLGISPSCWERSWLDESCKSSRTTSVLSGELHLHTI